MKTNFKLFILTLIFCALGFFVCVGLQIEMDLPSYLASALSGLTGSLLAFFRSAESKRWIACIYAGSFAGMIPLELISSVIDQIYLSLLVGVCFWFGHPYFRATGGKLGTIAFVACVIFALSMGRLAQ